MDESPTATKRCPKCTLELPLDSFNKNRSNKDGLAWSCRDCALTYRREWGKRNPDYDRERWESQQEYFKANNRKATLKRFYKMTPEEYAEMLLSQGGVCAICGIAQCSSGRAFAVDHDHSCCPGKFSCGKCVRGLLCGNCNKGLGNFQDDPEVMLTAIDYLRAGESK